MKLSKSLAMQEKAKKLIPGMTQLLSKRPDMFSQGVWPGYYQKAKGAEVWDLDGNRYVDMSIGGIGATILGYADDDVDQAVIEAIHNGVASSLNCVEEVELAELLCELHPWAEMARFTRAGGEAMSVAVRIARAHTGKDKVAFCGYHGWHDWYLAANLASTSALDGCLLPGLEPNGVPSGLRGSAFPFHYNNAQELRDIFSSHGKEIGVIVIESIRNKEPSEEFLSSVRELADESGAVLIVDEISAGFRLNTGGAHLLLQLEPDIAVFSKALGNGYPIAAVIGKGDIMSSAQKSFISSTCWTERSGSTAALAMIKKHRAENVSQHLIGIGNSVRQGWQHVAENNSIEIEVGGMPPMSHFVFKHESAPLLKALFIQCMLEQGFLASTLCYAMYAHTEEHVKAYLAAADGAFTELADALRSGDIESRLKGMPSTQGFKRLT
ncbi:MAG: aminotransferase class III-fold pyridoxal phosphate-dependent enzyme [Mariprofundaceae bacterium]|nr:aminotransferase class III-fold pyridoxal phosphate-dependent enzyme [Mariprofundaceae bacterium]